MFERILKYRRDLHQIPELDFDLPKTSAYVRSVLEKLPCEVFSPDGHAVCAWFDAGAHEAVAFRSDMDALPICEVSGVPFSSRHQGHMHACGHDGHMAMVLELAQYVASVKDRLKKNVLLVFQPAEEGVGGALPMIEDGILENPHVDAAFALHVEPLEKTGNIQVKDGSIMASPDDFKIVVHGVGGHASAPEKCVNPVTIGTAIITEFEKLNATVLKDKPCVMTVCYFNGGTCNNAIPQTAEIMGTARSLDNKTREMLIELLDKTAHETAKKHGTTIDFTFNKLFPPVVNNNEMNDVIRNSAKKLTCINEVVTLDKPAMAGDDFSYFGENVPSAYFKLGVGNIEKGAVYPIHSPKFIADENALPIGSAILSQTAVDYLDTYNN